MDLHLDLGEVRAIAERQPFVPFFEPAKCLRHARLGHAERPHMHLMRFAFGKRGDRRHDRLLKDMLHLAGHAGNEKQAGGAERHREARCGAHRVVEHVRAFREIALLRIRFGHHPSERLELLPNTFDDALVAPKLHAGCLGCRRGGEIVRGRPEAARRDDNTMQFRKSLYQRHDSVHVVVHRGVLDDSEPELGQLFAKPGSVGVHQLTTGELGADR